MVGDESGRSPGIGALNGSGAVEFSDEFSARIEEVGGHAADGFAIW